MSTFMTTKSTSKSEKAQAKVQYTAQELNQLQMKIGAQRDCITELIARTKQRNPDHQKGDSDKLQVRHMADMNARLEALANLERHIATQRLAASGCQDFRYAKYFKTIGRAKLARQLS